MAGWASGACTDDSPEPAASPPVSTAPVSSTTAVTGPAVAGDFPGVWPFTSAAEAAAYVEDTNDGTYLDPVATAADFARLYLGMASPLTSDYRAGDALSGEVEIRPEADSQFVTTVLLRRAGEPGSPFVVIGAAAGRVELSQPAALAAITSPVTVAGRGAAFEGNILIQVREHGMGPGDFLGQEPLIGGSGTELEPFSGPVPFRDPTEPGGAVLALTFSARDGSVEQASVVRIFFGQAASDG